MTASGGDRAVSGGLAPGRPAPGRSAQGRSATRAAQRITCGFCGTRFVEDRSQAACQGCPLNTACGLIRCPTCGFENPRAPRWLSRIREWMMDTRTAAAVGEGGEP